MKKAFWFLRWKTWSSESMLPRWTGFWKVLAFSMGGFRLRTSRNPLIYRHCKCFLRYKLCRLRQLQPRIESFLRLCNSK